MGKALSAALDLPVDERLAMIEALWESIVRERGDGLAVSDAEREELDRRLEEHEATPEDTVAWADVLSELGRVPRR